LWKQIFPGANYDKSNVGRSFLQSEKFQPIEYWDFRYKKMNKFKIKDLVYFINPPKYLYVLIAYTVAADVLLIFEKHFPKDLRPRKAVEITKMYLDGYAVDAANAANAAYYAAYAAAYVANAAAYAADAVSTVSTTSAANAVYYAAKASSEEHIFNLILSLLPQMINYAVENQIKLFTGPGDFSEIFEMLTDEQKKSVIYNMDVIGGWK